MSRRDRELIAVAEFATRAGAEEVWATLIDQGVPSTIVTDDPPWGEARHFIQCARQDAAAAKALIDSAAESSLD